MALADAINEMIKKILESSTWTSAGGNRSDDVTNFVNEVRGIQTPDLEAEIREILGADESGIDQGKKISEVSKKVQEFDKGNVGDVQRFTSEQFNNVRGFATNPVQFMIQGVFKKFAKGAGVAALALVFMEVVKFIIGELLKPGRLLDIRFKRDFKREYLLFRSREEKQKLLQGKSSIIITTIGGLRGGKGQISSNLRALAGLQEMPIPTTFYEPGTPVKAAGVDLKTSSGRKRGRGSVFR